jgi:protein TonB
MFEQALAIEYGRTNRSWTTLLGMAGQAVAVTGLIVVQMVGTDALPRPESLVHLFTPTAPLGPPPPPPASGAAQRPVRRALQLRDGVLAAPTSVPPRALEIEEPPLAGSETGVPGRGVQGGIPGGVEGGIPGGLPLTAGRHVPPPVAVIRPVEAAPALPKPAEPQRIRRGGEVQAALLIHKALPVYPPLARQARISGAVELLAVVGTDGRIRQLQLVSGHPMLAAAAIEAVRQWVYRPTQLNGDPVEVMAPIIVTFSLN